MTLEHKDSAGKLLPRFLCHKEVQALKIKRVDWRPATRNYALIPEDGGYQPMMVTPEWVDKFGPTAGGYYVLYQDGYASYSPAKAFEEGYSAVQE